MPGSDKINSKFGKHILTLVDIISCKHKFLDKVNVAGHK